MILKNKEGYVLMKKEQKLTKILFAIYLVILTWIILFKMQVSIGDLPNIRNINLVPYGQSAIVNGRIDLEEIIYNAVAFIPVGVYVAMLGSGWSFWKKILSAAGISLIYEILQYAFAIGATDITDLINNTIGGIVGILITMLFSMMLKERAYKVLNILAAIGTVLVVGLLTMLSVVN